MATNESILSSSEERLPPMSRFIKCVSLLCVASLLPLLSLQAQQSPPTTKDQPPPRDSASPAATKSAAKPARDPIDRIKEEGLKRSQVMETLSYLTDVIGPRLTGSPAMKRANTWTRDKLASWGLENAHLEAWGKFGRGWSLKRFSAQVVEPQCIPLIAYPKAWSPGTGGPLVAPVVLLDASTEADLARYKGKLEGAIVLTSPVRNLTARFEPLATRLSDSDLLALADAPESGRGGFGRRPAPTPPGDQQRSPGGITVAGGASGSGNGDGAAPSTGAGGPSDPTQQGPSPRGRGPSPFARRKLQFLIEEGAAVLVDPSSQGDGGTLFVASASIPVPVAPTPASSAPVPGASRPTYYDPKAPATLPQVVLATEHYNRLARMLQQGEALRMEIDLSVAFHDDDLMAYNTIAEIPGTDLKDEFVMLGGHMDSWHSGTGATDNAAGVAVAMEAVRILRALELKPRRTVRIALWTGEEQGLLGSRGYVSEHFKKVARPRSDDSGGRSSTAEATSAPGAEPASAADAVPKPEYAGFSAYFNLDNGTGKIRGVYLQGNEAVRPIFRRWLQPFRDMGATTLSIANTGGTDHLSFDGVGLPGFQFIQDRIEYGTRTHHSNQDVYDRIQADDMKQAAVIMAAFVYNTAMLDEKLPRKPAAQ
jgi:hypothetical protein